MKKGIIKMLSVVLLISAGIFCLTACGHTHEYKEEIIKPTCTEQGYTIHRCDCGEEYIDSYVDALGHDFNNYVSNNNATCEEDGTKTSSKKELDNKKVKDNNGNAIQGQGVYLFVINKKLNFNIDFFNKEVTGIFFKDGCSYSKKIGVPPYNDSDKILKEGHIFYVGTAGQVNSRLIEHWHNDKINGCCSLKLGLKSRNWIKKFLDIYYISNDDITANKTTRGKLEKAIRDDYGSYMGK